MPGVHLLHTSQISILDPIGITSSTYQTGIGIRLVYCLSSYPTDLGIWYHCSYQCWYPSTTLHIPDHVRTEHQHREDGTDDVLFLSSVRGSLQALPCFHRRRAQDGSSSSITSSSSDGLCGRNSGLSGILIFFSGCSFAADDTCCTFFVW